jgi:hypothetical protein
MYSGMAARLKSLKHNLLLAVYILLRYSGMADTHALVAVSVVV